jgi:hypothetical protein
MNYIIADGLPLPFNLQHYLRVAIFPAPISTACRAVALAKEDHHSSGPATDDDATSLNVRRRVHGI